MKTVFHPALIIFSILFAFVACKPKDYMKDLETVVPNTDSSVVANLHPRVEIDAENPNLVHFIMDETDGYVGVWFIGGRRYPQSRLDRYYEFAGDYTVQAFAYNHFGTTPSVNVHFSVLENDPSVCTNLNYKYLTGGCDYPDGKTWMLANETGYYGLIDINTWSIEYLSDYWWAAERGSHNGVYDDELTFVLNADKTYRHKTNGDSGKDSEAFPIDDYTANWELTSASESADGRMHISLMGDAFFPPIPSECEGQHEYTILTLNDTVMIAKIYKSGSNQAWVYKFTPKTSQK